MSFVCKSIHPKCRSQTRIDIVAPAASDPAPERRVARRRIRLRIRPSAKSRMLRSPGRKLSSASPQRATKMKNCPVRCCTLDAFGVSLVGCGFSRDNRQANTGLPFVKEANPKRGPFRRATTRISSKSAPVTPIPATTVRLRFVLEIEASPEVASPQQLPDSAKWMGYAPLAS